MEKNNAQAAGVIYRIGVLGPESTGKSTLCAALAAYYHTVWVPEYSREYIPLLTDPYTLADIEMITKKQMEMEREAMKSANRFLFADTELIVAKVWCEDAFKQSPPWIETGIRELKYDYYLLMVPDLPWVEDPVRENGHRRDYFFNWYKKELDDRKFPYAIISGKDESRLKNSTDALKQFFKIQG